MKMTKVTKPKFGDKRDTVKDPKAAGCTSALSFSTMPRRERGPENKSGYVPA